MAKISPCPLCYGKNFEPLFNKAGRHFVRCQRDGLVMVNPIPGENEIKKIYEEDYFDWQDREAAACIGYWAYVKEKPLLLEYFGRKVKLLKQLGVKGKVLDVGCGHGFFLEAAKERGLEAIGIDLSPQAIAYAKKNKLKVYETDLKDAPFKPNSFAAVTAFQLIEHVTDPVDFLKDVYKALAPNGVILLATPKAEGYLHRLMGKHWLSFRHREHLYFFSAKTLSLALSEAGFVNIRVLRENTRFYPISHLLGGVKFYFKWPWLAAIADFAGTLLRHLGLLEFKIPMPLDSLVMVAQKS